MAEVVLDANVLVAMLDARDVHAARAAAFLARLDADGHEPGLVDFLLAEAVSVLARRARERRNNPPDLALGLATARRWYEEGAIQFLAGEGERAFADVLDTIEATGGTLNFNDALLVVLQREGVIGDVASFDEGLARVAGFRRVA